MTGILKFQLPEEEIEFRTAVHAAAWRAVVEDTLQSIRGAQKYVDWNGEEPPTTPEDVLERVRQQIVRHVTERGLSLDD